jgi:hypothetical protein
MSTAGQLPFAISCRGDACVAADAQCRIWCRERESAAAPPRDAGVAAT